jgi:hypothetical protein
MGVWRCVILFNYSRENTDESCTFHPGAPYFHDAYKGTSHYYKHQCSYRMRLPGNLWPLAFYVAFNFYFMVNPCKSNIA